ncbi:MAG: septal ring lytic transglycosylase RlpA family protein [Candidatus Neomarinimicrobiota bacterium]
MMHPSLKILITVSGALLFLSCTTAPRYKTGPVRIKKTGSIKLQRNSSKIIYGTSSYYGQDFHGKLTANGEVFDMYGLTAAHKKLPLNTIVRVTNLENNKSLILRINDRGPYVAGRILDCSYGAAKKLGFLSQGTAKVKIEIIEIGDDEYMQHKESNS